MHWGKGFTVLGVAALAFLLVASAADGLSSGVTKQKGPLPKEGCTCHGEGGADSKKGIPNPKVVIDFKIDGNPYTYKKGTTYNISIGVRETDVPLAGSPDLNKGGFNLKVSFGKLAPAPGYTDFVQVSGLEATHTSAGDKHGRMWNLTWVPDQENDGAVFQVFVNTVNGDGSPNAEDHWNGAVFGLMGKSGNIGGAEETPEEIGVRWLAHWVGVISFIAVFVVLVLYYFVLKYGETVHATDHRDRKEK